MSTLSALFLSFIAIGATTWGLLVQARLDRLEQVVRRLRDES